MFVREGSVYSCMGSQTTTHVSRKLQAGLQRPPYVNYLLPAHSIPRAILLNALTLDMRYTYKRKNCETDGRFGCQGVINEIVQTKHGLQWRYYLAGLFWRFALYLVTMSP